MGRLELTKLEYDEIYKQRIGNKRQILFSRLHIVFWVVRILPWVRSIPEGLEKYLVCRGGYITECQALSSPFETGYMTREIIFKAFSAQIFNFLYNFQFFVCFGKDNLF